MVDNAVLQNELLESEKAKQVAKQTVKIKSSGESNILQSKLMELKSSKVTFQSDQKETSQIEQHAQEKGAAKVI